MKSFKVVVLGAGKVGSPLLSMMKESSYPFEVTAIAVSDLGKHRGADGNYTTLDAAIDVEADVYVDCLPYSNETLNSLMGVLKQGKTLITCSKEFVEKHALEIHEVCKEHGGKAYFNSIPASPVPTGYAYLNLTDKNIHRQDINDLLEFRQADGEVTAKFIFQDLVRCHHKTNPSYERDRLARIAIQKEQKRIELEKIALAHDTTLEAQPCGIDPKLPDGIVEK